MTIRRVNELVHDVSLGGMLLPWRIIDDQPYLLEFPESVDLFLPLFSDREHLDGFLDGKIDTRLYKIKQIDDGMDFLTSIPTVISTGSKIRLILDPYQTDIGTTRFKEIQR